MTRFDIFCCMALATGAVSFGAHAQPAAGSPGTDTDTGTGTQDILAGMQVVVAADGSVTSVEPDAALPEAIRTALVKRVAHWRYKVPMWQGQPVSISVRQGLRLQAVPTTSGGYALRVMGDTYVPDPDPRYVQQPPAYPSWSQRKGVGAALVYAIHVGTDGSLTDVRRLYPEQLRDPAGKAFDEAARAAIATWAWRPVLVNGAPVACDLAMPITFVITGDAPPKEPDLEPLQAGLQICPDADLETRIEGTLL